MKPIVEAVARELLYAEMTPERKARNTNKAENEIYLFSGAEAPALMREVGRLREEAFRESGGGTGEELDIDEDDLAPEGYMQLIVWDPRDEEIVGGYRFIVCDNPNPKHLSTEHYFDFSEKFRNEYLPYTIELGRSFVQVKYQARRNPKGIYALDNLWDGLGALIVLNPEVKYFFGKVTMYTTYQQEARNALIYFMHKYFPDNERLMVAHNPVAMNIDEEALSQLFSGGDYNADYRILLQKIRECNESIPALFNAYMSLSNSMKVFDTFLNSDFGAVEETGILITIPDIYPDKKERYTRWDGWATKLEERRLHWTKKLRELNILKRR